MRAKSNNYKIATIAQMFIFMWRFIYRSRRGCLNSLITSLPRLQECIPRPQMIDTSISSFRLFDWISALSSNVSFFLECARRHFDALRFWWQLSTITTSFPGLFPISLGKKAQGTRLSISQVKQDPFTHKFVSSALQTHFKCTWNI